MLFCLLPKAVSKREIFLGLDLKTAFNMLAKRHQELTV